MIREYPVLDWSDIDGDTVAVTVDLGFRATLKFKVRLQGMDAPELSDPVQCPAGSVSAEALNRWLHYHRVKSGGSFIARIAGPDKYTGRWVGDLVRAEGWGQTAAEWMLKSGYARPYKGEKKEPWTTEELEAIVALGKNPPLSDGIEA